MLDIADAVDELPSFLVVEILHGTAGDDEWVGLVEGLALAPELVRRFLTA